MDWKLIIPQYWMILTNINGYFQNTFVGNYCFKWFSVLPNKDYGKVLHQLVWKTWLIYYFNYGYYIKTMKQQDLSILPVINVADFTANDTDSSNTEFHFQSLVYNYTIDSSIFFWKDNIQLNEE